MQRNSAMSLALVMSLTIAMSSLIVGCGSGGTPPNMAPDADRRVALNDVGELYRSYQLGTKKSPKSIKDLERYEMGAPMGLAAIKKGSVVLLYEATLPDLGEEPGKVTSDEVLAYEKEVPESGGLVLMLDRTIKEMTAEQFTAARQAGKPSATPKK